MTRFRRCASVHWTTPRVALSRAAFFFGAVGVLLLGARRPAAASAPCTEGLTVDWTFHASAPLAVAPAVSKQGWVVVASVDGYVHALAPGGRFQWSYTLDSAPSGIAIGEDGRTYALSQAGVLHVLHADGRHQWGSRLPAGMVPTGPLAQNEQGVVFVPSHLNLYAFAAGAGLSWRAFIGSEIVAGPIATAAGDAWVATRDARLVRVHTPRDRSQFSLPEDNAGQVVGANTNVVLVLIPEGAASTLVAFDHRGHERWRYRDVRRVSSDGSVLERRGPRGASWTWIEPSTGQVLGERTLGLESSAAPSSLGARAVVPTVDGRVYVFGEEGRVEWCRIAAAPLLEPRVGALTERITVAAGDGRFASVRFRTSTGRRRLSKSGSVLGGAR